MYAEQIRQAVQVCHRGRLSELSEAVWKGYAAGAIGEEEAQSLAEMIESRKEKQVSGQIGREPASTRRVGSRPQTTTSMARRRSWAAGSWMPPAMAAAFTTAELAALSVIITEIATQGSCELPAAAIAGRAGISTTSARNAVREARKRGILRVVERRISYSRNEPNLITVASRELALWVRTRARAKVGETPPPVAVERQRGGVKSVTPTTNHLYSFSARPVAADWIRGLSVREVARSGPVGRRRTTS